jgi:hypothetical protein
MQQPPDETLGDVLRGVVPVDAAAMSEARPRQARLTKSAGATLCEKATFDSAGAAKKEHRDG